MPPHLARRHVVRSCKQRGWTIQPLALQGILDLAVSEEDVEEILDLLNMKGKKIVTIEVFQELVDNDKSQNTHNTNGSTDNKSQRPGDKNTSSLSVINAFETPKLVYEVMRKHFYVEEKRYSLFGTAEDKTNMLCRRYALIHQRLLRHDLFRPKDLTRNSTQHKLTPIESLLGKTHNETLLLLGMLLQIEEGQWYLEDPTGQVPISFQTARVVDGSFVTEQCVLLVEGSFHEGIFYVQRVGQPMLERRETSIAAIQQHVSHPAFLSSVATAAWKKKKKKSHKFETNAGASSFVLLSDVHLDQPRVLQQLEALFATYEKFSPQELPVFVLMGNFSSDEGETASATAFAATSTTASSNTPPMEELASLIASFTNLSKNAQFVLVPGPNDTISLTLPFANTLSRAGFSRIQHVHWATNPCRIRFCNTNNNNDHGGGDDDIDRCSNEMVIFRYDLLHLMQRQQLLLEEPPRSEIENKEDKDDPKNRKPHCRLIKTLLYQGHLCPVTSVPIAWNYDHALSLYPVPHVIVLGGDGASSKESRFHEVHEDCHIIHPGSMAADGSYAVYYSNSSGNKENDYDDDDDDGGPRIEFGQLGVDK